MENTKTTTQLQKLMYLSAADKINTDTRLKHALQNIVENFIINKRT